MILLNNNEEAIHNNDEKVIMITTISVIIIIKALCCDISRKAKKTMITMTIPTPLTITMPQIVAFTKTKTTMLITTSFT